MLSTAHRCPALVQNAPALAAGLVVIDPGVDAPEVLAAGVQPDSTVLILDPTQDAIEQIAIALAQGHYHSLHLVAHGRPGCIHWTHQALNLSTLGQHRQMLMEWDVAEIWLYSCHVAQAPAFLEELHRLSGASIAASAHQVGKKNWSLEYEWGTIQGNIAFGEKLQHSYRGTFDLDTDGDGLTDDVELGLGTSPTNPDTDSDGLGDLEEVTNFGTSPTNPDTDLDGLSDREEVFDFETDPRNQDTDGDGLSDGIEISLSTNPNEQDTDNDELDDGEEVFDFETDPTNPDTDNDGVSDGEERGRRIDPLNPDTDNDGLDDGEELFVFFTIPDFSDSDLDGLDDREEVLTFKTDPLTRDTDGDGLLDGVEVNDLGSDPLDPTDPVCYLTGTHIMTEQGEVLVENLSIGDRVQTADGALEPIKWIGRQTCEPRRIRNPLRGYPILIKVGALGNGRPQRDLYVSPDHALLFEGLLINAGALVNDVSIIKTLPTKTFTYYHIELDKHALLMAEGTAAESYLPQNEDRMIYDNGVEYEELYPSGNRIILWPLDYPRISSYSTVPRYIRKKLKAIAIELGLVAKAS